MAKRATADLSYAHPIHVTSHTRASHIGICAASDDVALALANKRGRNFNATVVVVAEGTHTGTTVARGVQRPLGSNRNTVSVCHN